MITAISVMGSPLLASAGATFLQTLTKSIALGCVYALVALGFVLVFKASQVLNFATGGLSMAGAIFMSILIADRGFPFLPFTNPLAPEAGETASIPLWMLHIVIAMLFAALLAVVLERVAIRPLVGQPLFALAVVTLGLEVALTPFNRDATAISSRNLGVPWKTETWEVAGAIIPKSYLAAAVAAAIGFSAILLFYRSRLGIAMRAVAFDQEAAMAQGINVGRIFSISWALGASVAALGAIMFGMAPFPPGGAVSQEVHTILAFRVLPVIILGGLDSVMGALYGGLIIASFEVFAGEYLSGYNDILGPGYSTIVPYIVMLIVLLVKPYGLFGTAEIRRV